MRGRLRERETDIERKRHRCKRAEMAQIKQSSKIPPDCQTKRSGLKPMTVHDLSVGPSGVLLRWAVRYHFGKPFRLI